MTQTIFEAYNQTKKELSAAGIVDYGFDAREIIRRVTGYTNAQILSRYNTHLTEIQQNYLKAMVKQRRSRYPLQYILGEWSFYGRDFSVGPGVLCPRADTETCVEAALEFLKNRPSAKVLDLCAGTGCIGLTLAKECPDSTVTLVEKYAPALGYLTKNIDRCSAANATAVCGDVLQGIASDGKYDLIVSNPPYIPDGEMAELPPEVKFEPETALAGGEDGCDFYRTILANYKGSLLPGGMICFEVDGAAADTVAAFLCENGFSDVGRRSDANGIERVVFGTLKDV